MLAEPIPSAIRCSRLSKYHQETERHCNVGAVPGSMRRLVRPPLPFCWQGGCGTSQCQQLFKPSSAVCHYASSNLDEWKGECGYMAKSYGVIGALANAVYILSSPPQKRKKKHCSRSVFSWLREARGRKTLQAAGMPVCQVLSASVLSSEGRVRRWPFYLPGSQHVAAGVVIESGGTSKTNSSSKQDFDRFCHSCNLRTCGDNF